MANTIDQDLMQELLNDASIAALVGTRVHYNHVPESYEGTFLFVRRSTAGDDEDRYLNDPTGVKYRFRETFDVEAVSEDIDEETSLALLLKTLNNKQSTLGTGTCQVVFVREHSDDYSPKGVDSDVGLFVGAVEFEIINYAESA